MPALRKKSQKKSAQFGRFFFSASPCMVEENFTGKLLRIAVLSPQSSRPAADKPLINLSKCWWHSPCLFRGYASTAYFSQHGRGTMNNDIAEGKWKQMVGKAKTAWGELTDDELTKAEGRADKLAGLIQERYGKTREEAELEVRRFFDSNRDF
jgi:uncharacterized protein YjbJ (UPF0337 family)